MVSSKHSENYFLLLLHNMQFVEKQHEDLDEDIDLRAMENGFVSVLSHVYVCVLVMLPFAELPLGND